MQTRQSRGRVAGRYRNGPAREIYGVPVHKLCIQAAFQEMAAVMPEVRPCAVRRARALLLAGNLDTPEAVAKAAEVLAQGLSLRCGLK